MCLEEEGAFEEDVSGREEMKMGVSFEQAFLLSMFPFFL